MMIPKYSRWLLPVSMLVSPLAYAIEPPADQAAPPAVGAEQAEQAQAEEFGYLGLVSGPIPEVLSTHLGVRNGEGVLVRSVMPDGPAAQAGIKAHDVIITIDGQSALSHAELARIVRSHQPGDQVNVGLIQAGKGTDLVVTLGKRPDDLAQLDGGDAADAFRMQGMPDDMALRLRDMIEGNMLQFQFDGEGIQPGAGLPNIQRDMEQMREQMKELREQQQNMLKDGPAIGLNANTTIRLMDGEGSVELSSNNGESKLVVRDKENNIQWQGPWNNDEDKAAAPEDIRKRAENLKMNGGNGAFRLEFGR